MAKGQGRMGTGVTFTKYEITIKEDAGPKSVTVPAVNFWYRYGLTDKLEAHALAWIPFGATLGAKYQLLGNRELNGPSVSVGLDFGYLTVSDSSEDAMGVESKTEIQLADFYLPVHVGYRVGPSFSVYAVPKYLLRVESGDSDGISHMVGSAFGLALGNVATLHAEGVVLYDVGAGNTALTAGIGYAF